MKGVENRYERVWGTTLIVVGIVLLGVVFVAAFAITTDPGGYYDRWVPGDETKGPEASYDWASSGLEVGFTDTSKAGDAAIQRWVWDFGDGTGSNDPNPSHPFAEAGEWSVTLDVVDDNGLSSKAEGTVEIDPQAANSGDGAIGLNDLADKVTDTVERSAKGGLVVLLVIGMFVVLTMIGGRLILQGARVLRPVPDKVSVKLRPKQLELAVLEPRSEAEDATEAVTSGPPPPTQQREAEEPVEAGV